MFSCIRGVFSDQVFPTAPQVEDMGPSTPSVLLPWKLLLAFSTSPLDSLLHKTTACCSMLPPHRDQPRFFHLFLASYSAMTQVSARVPSPLTIPAATAHRGPLLFSQQRLAILSTLEGDMRLLGVAVFLLLMFSSRPNFVNYTPCFVLQQEGNRSFDICPQPAVWSPAFYRHLQEQPSLQRKCPDLCPAHSFPS